MSEVVIYTDGGARGNPGPAGAGAVLMKDGAVVEEIKKFLGEIQTNNWAEYEAVFLALTRAKELGLNSHATEVRLDSKLVGEQLSGNWKVKEPSLKPQWMKVRSLIAGHFKAIRFVYVPREQNKEADRLVNEAVDEAGY